MPIKGLIPTVASGLRAKAVVAVTSYQARHAAASISAVSLLKAVIPAADRSAKTGRRAGSVSPEVIGRQVVTATSPTDVRHNDKVTKVGLLLLERVGQAVRCIARSNSTVVVALQGLISPLP